MGIRNISDESGESVSDDENVEFDDEEEANEEDTDEEDPDEIDSGEELAADFSEGPDEDNLCEQELDEVEPNEDSCDENSHEEELNGKLRKGAQSFEEDQMRQPCEEISDEEEEEELVEEEEVEEGGGEEEEEVEEGEEEEEVEEEETVEEVEEEETVEEEEEEELVEEEEGEEPVEEEEEGEPVEEEEEGEPLEEEEEELIEEEEEEGEPVEAESVEEEPVEELVEEDELVEEELEEESDEEPFEEAAAEFDAEDDTNEEPAAQSKSGNKILLDTAGASKKDSNVFVAQNLYNSVDIAGNMGSTELTGKKRRSRWDTVEPAEDGGNTGAQKKKSRWSRWSSEYSGSSMATSSQPSAVAVDLEVPKLLAQLSENAGKMQSQMVDDRPESERSPSPPPIFNNLGIRINTREARYRFKLMLEGRKIISELISKNPNYKPPKSFKTSKLQQKLYIPFKKYPEYNFVGLILGPSGNTQKRMEKETGAKILLRGNGSGFHSKKLDPSDSEDMHVLIEADNKYSLDVAVAMVSKLLVPVEDGNNSHKLSQLRELAQMRGNLRVKDTKDTRNLNKHESCDICGEASHRTSSCPLTAPTPGTNPYAHEVNFHAEMGDALSPISALAASSSSGNSTSSRTPQPKKEIDESNLFVGCLPHSVDNNKLRELFSPFGPLAEAKVIKDKQTGVSKGFGFVKYRDRVNAAMAVSQMNGYKIDGKMLVVRVAGVDNSNSASTCKDNKGPVFDLPTYPGPAVAVPYPVSLPGPPESMLPVPFPYSSSNQTNSVHFSGFSGRTPAPTSLISGNSVTSDELSQFPGYLKSFDPPSNQSPVPPLNQFYHQPARTGSLPSSQDHFSGSLYSRDYFSQSFGSYQWPPS